jgi:hypothetical protein
MTLDRRPTPFEIPSAACGRNGSAIEIKDIHSRRRSRALWKSAGFEAAG